MNVELLHRLMHIIIRTVTHKIVSSHTACWLYHVMFHCITINTAKIIKGNND